MDQQPEQPTEDALRHARIVHKRYPIELCEIDCWQEDDEQVVRASDFDLYAVGSTREEAVAKFVAEVYSLVDALQGLGEDDITEEEQRLFVRLATPIVEAYRQDQRREQRRLVVFPRLRGDHSPAREWSPSSSRARSNQLSRA